MPANGFLLGTAMTFILLSNALAATCGGQVMQADEKCCANATKYKVGEQICCEDKIVFYVRGDETNYYNDHYMCCKYEHLWSLPHTLASCCGGNPFDMETQGCCNEIIHDLKGEACCMGVLYDINDQHCCNNRVFLNKDKLDGIYYSADWMCCEEKNPWRRENYDACCGKKPYNKATQLCCADGSTQDRNPTGESGGASQTC